MFGIQDIILNNIKQINEWKELQFGDIKCQEDLYLKKDLFDIEYKKLPLDTKYFSEDFKEQLLENLTKNHNLDDILDGLLIKSENWQALNTILIKYKEQVQTIYIDPPFNKEQDADFLYNVKYKDSTWASLLENRISLSKRILDEKGSIFVRCDYNGNWIIRPLMNEIYGEDNFRNELIINRTLGYSRRAINNYEIGTESLIWYTKNSSLIVFNRLWKDREITWLPMRVKYNKGGPSGNPIIIEGKEFYPPEGYSWFVGNEIANEMYKRGRLRVLNDKLWALIDKANMTSNWTDILGYEKPWEFQTRNSEILLKRVSESTSNESNLVMDFFLGSGTTTAVAQKLGRKWIGIEMGDHFWTVVMPRMKKVLFYDKSGISKEKDVKERYNENKAGGFFKYQVLEQYEDTLDNLEINNLEKEQIELEFGDKYLLRYFLEYETKANPSLLNIDKLQSPFSYKLKVNLEEVGEPEEMVVDLPETFNYLLGIKVKKVKVRNSGRKYLFIEGEKEKQEIAIIWREYDANWKEKDYEEDKKFIREELKEWAPQVVYINGQSILTPDFEDFRADIRSIESEFKRLMG